MAHAVFGHHVRTAPDGEGNRLAGIGRPDPHRPNAGYVIGKETFAWARGSGRDAPIPVIRSTVGSGFWAELSSWTSAEFEQVPDEHEELPFGRVPGTVTLSSRVLREDSTARRQAANVAVARLEFNLGCAVDCATRPYGCPRERDKSYHPVAASVSDRRSGRLFRKTCLGSRANSTSCIWFPPAASA